MLLSVTTLEVLAFLSANVPVAETVTLSPAIKPIPTIDVLFTPDVLTVAEVQPSYTLLSAVMPEMVNALAVMLAVVLACEVML